MKNPIPLRAHHGLCLAFFEGRGYSEGFTVHMQTVLAGMADDPLLELVAEQDVICSSCPNLSDGLCNTPQLVQGYDQSVLNLCGLEAPTQIYWSDFSRLVKEKILTPGRRQSICGDCPWTNLCTARESTPNY